MEIITTVVNVLFKLTVISAGVLFIWTILNCWWYETHYTEDDRTADEIDAMYFSQKN